MKQHPLPRIEVPAVAEPDESQRGGAELHLMGLWQMAGGRPKAMIKPLVEARWIYRDYPKPALEAFRLYYLGAWRRIRGQPKSARVLLEAAAALYSRAGKDEDTAYALVEMGRTFLMTGELVELLRIQQRLLAILPEVTGTGLTPERFLSKARRWAKELGIPAANRGELATLLRTRKRVAESCQPHAELRGGSS
ncbi:MAG: hypothetical protein GY856_52220 [bacterium]|nr:hypothetical protein [bacterium]